MATREIALQPKVKALLAAAIAEKGRDDVYYLASVTGLSAVEVEVLLRDEAYWNNLRSEARIIMTHALLRGVKTLERILKNRREKTPNKVAAHRAIAHTFQIATLPQQKSPETPAEETLKWWLDKHGTPTSTEKDERSGPTRPDPEAKEARRTGTHPAA